jgi:hypothetical protein
MGGGQQPLREQWLQDQENLQADRERGNSNSYNIRNR